jgi:UDP-N-acetyl-D-glucosamine dehydrogenase
VKTELINKIKERKANIGIIGLGYVGLPLVIEFFKAGFPVFGFDIDSEKIALLNQGTTYIKHIDITQLSKKHKNHGSFQPTIDFTLLKKMDCIIVCVPTPLNQNREPDMQYVFQTTEIISKFLRKGQLIVLESTTYPGTTDEDMRKILEETGFKAGVDFYLAFSPEREDPNNKDYNLRTVPKVVGGYTENCLKVAKSLYDTVVKKTVTVSSTKVAEATKLLENIYRAVNIALVNELKMLFDKMGIDIWEVIEAAKTKPFGFQAFYPGPGLGGHCIPVDPFYLTWKAREYNFYTRFIELAGEINNSMPNYVLEKIAKALNDNKKSLKGSAVLVIGVAYKPDVDDDRESPAYVIMDLLMKEGASVDYSDPYIPQLKKSRKYNFRLSSIDLVPENIKNYDVVLIVTNHSSIDYSLIRDNAKIIVDTRNTIKKRSKEANIYKA